MADEDRVDWIRVNHRDAQRNSDFSRSWSSNLPVRRPCGLTDSHPTPFTACVGESVWVVREDTESHLHLGLRPRDLAWLSRRALAVAAASQVALVELDEATCEAEAVTWIHVAGAVRELACSDEKHVAAAGQGRIVTVLSDVGRPMASLPAPANVSSIRWLSRSTLSLTSERGTLALLDLRTGKSVQHVSLGSRHSLYAHANVGRHRVFVGLASGDMEVLDWRNLHREPRASFRAPSLSVVGDLQYHPTWDLLIATGLGATVTFKGASSSPVSSLLGLSVMSVHSSDDLTSRYDAFALSSNLLIANHSGLHLLPFNDHVVVDVNDFFN